MARLLFFITLLFSVPVTAQTPLSQSPVFKALQAQALNITGPDTASVQRTRNAKAGDIVSVKDFCAVNDGVTSNTTCVQAAMSALCARSPAGGTLYFPQGKYALSAAGTITSTCQGVWIAGAGWGDHTNGQGGTQINLIGTGSAITFRWASNTYRTSNKYASGGGIRDLIIASTNTNTAIAQTGAMISFEHCEGCTVSNVRLWSPFVGVNIYAGIGNRVTSSQISQVVAGGTGVAWSGSDTEAGCSSNYGTCSGRSDILTVDHMVMDAANQISSTQHMADCITVKDFAATLWVQNVACNQFRRGLSATCPTSGDISRCPAFFSIFDLESEANDGALGANDGFNIYLSDVTHAVCTGCQLFGYAINNNVVAAAGRFATAGDIQFLGGRMGYARQDCFASNIDQVYLGAGLNIQGCGQSGTGYYGAVFRAPITGGINNSVMVQGVDFCRNPGTAGTGSPYAMGAVQIYGGTDYAVVTGNRLRSCGSGITDSSGATHNVIANNTGL